MPDDLARELALVAKSLLVQFRNLGRAHELDVADFALAFRPVILKSIHPVIPKSGVDMWNWDELEGRALQLAAERIDQTLAAIERGKDPQRNPELGRPPVPIELMLFAAMLRRLRTIDEKLAKT